MFHFYTPWKRQKTKVFMASSGGKEMDHWAKMDQTYNHDRSLELQGSVLFSTVLVFRELRYAT